ncbi:MAG TPA: DnaB-like helicase C-terminal domain-containing protein [Verrucomicrobiota bacterium]|nr:DnaB-like helicase C-terminal domain-containing protein [Verrucomicrobiota bacterium]
MIRRGEDLSRGVRVWIASNCGLREDSVMRSELSPIAALHRAIGYLERLHQSGIGRATIPLDCAPHARLALRTALDCAVAQQQPTAFASETFSNDEAVLHLLSLQSRISLKTVASHQLKEGGFARLVEAAGLLSSSPLFLLADDPSHPQVTAENLLRLSRTRGVKVVVSERQWADGLAPWRSTLAAYSQCTGVRVYLLAGQRLAVG